MIKIAIVDDQELWGQRLEEDISDLLKKEAKSFQIQSMTKGQTLLDEYRDGNSFDLLFIDIEMDGMDGIQLGDQIRKLWDKRVKMVYISAYPEKVYKAINYDLLGFIDKASYRKEDLDLVLKRAIKKLEKEIEYYVYYQDRQKKINRYRKNPLLF